MGMYTGTLYVAYMKALPVCEILALFTRVICEFSNPRMKRRRTRTPSDAGSPSQEKKTVKSPPTSSKSTSSSIKEGPSKSSDAQHTGNLEDMEVERRSATSDVASFERGTEEIRKLLSEIQNQNLAVRFSLILFWDVGFIPNHAYR